LRRLRLVVVGDELDLVDVAADLQAARLVDLVGPHLGAALQLDAVRRRAARQRTEQADRERLLGRRRRTRPDDSKGDGEDDEDREAASCGHGSPPSVEGTALSGIWE